MVFLYPNYLPTNSKIMWWIHQGMWLGIFLIIKWENHQKYFSSYAFFNIYYLKGRVQSLVRPLLEGVTWRVTSAFEGPIYIYIYSVWDLPLTRRVLDRIFWSSYRWCLGSQTAIILSTACFAHSAHQERFISVMYGTICKDTYRYTYIDTIILVKTIKTLVKNCLQFGWRSCCYTSK